MNIYSPNLTAILFAHFILHASSFLLAQGPLTPPGAPAPTMKTLDQIEARTPAGAVTISERGVHRSLAEMPWLC